MNPLRETLLHRRLNRRFADRIRELGFRKWYERELLAGHAHMVLAFLSVIAVVASFEAFRDASISEKLMDVLFVLVCAAIGLWALRRYLYLLMRAENMANQAVCAHCGEYGRFEVIGEDRSRDETQVACLKCAHHWTLTP